MLSQGHSAEREEIIARAMTGVLRELRLVNVEYYVSFITLGLYDHIADLVNSAAEPYLVPGFLKFGQGGEASLDWQRQPAITLDLCLDAGNATVNFAVTLEAESAGVRIDYISFDTGLERPEDNTAYLRRMVDAICLQKPDRLLNPPDGATRARRQGSRKRANVKQGLSNAE